MQKIYTTLIGLENTKYPSYMHTRFYTAVLLALLLLGTSAYTHDASQPTNDASTQCSNGSSTVQSNVQSSDATQGPADWESIGHTLGCVFAPHTCKSKK